MIDRPHSLVLGLQRVLHLLRSCGGARQAIARLKGAAWKAEALSSFLPRRYASKE